MIIHHIIPSEDITIYLQELPRQYSDIPFPLLEKDAKQLGKLKNPGRKREFLAVRHLLHQVGLDNNLTYDKKRPQLKNSGYNISISHCKTHAAIALSQLPVGVDLEIPGNRIRKTAGKFLSHSEKKMAADDISRLTLFWSAKECVYKINNKLSNFKQQMEITAYDADKRYIGIDSKNKHYSCFYKDLSDVLVTWCVE
ncbi:MAG: 4'-phosphopantetheinyl transferase family protein [Bacteroidales bacterium]